MSEPTHNSPQLPDDSMNKNIYRVYQKIEGMLLGFIQHANAQAIERMEGLLKSAIKLLEGAKELKRMVLEPLDPQPTVILTSQIIEIDPAQPSLSPNAQTTPKSEKVEHIAPTKEYNIKNSVPAGKDSEIAEITVVPNVTPLSFIPSSPKISTPDIPNVHYSKIRNPTPKSPFNYVGIIHDIKFSLFGKCRNCDPSKNTCESCIGKKGGIRAELKIVLLDGTTETCTFWTNLIKTFIGGDQWKWVSSLLATPDEFRRQILEIYRGHPIYVSGQYRPYKSNIYPTITKMDVVKWEYIIPILMDVMPA